MGGRCYVTFTLRIKDLPALGEVLGFKPAGGDETCEWWSDIHTMENRRLDLSSDRPVTVGLEETDSYYDLEDARVSGLTFFGSHGLMEERGSGQFACVNGDLRFCDSVSWAHRPAVSVDPETGRIGKTELLVVRRFLKHLKKAREFVLKGDEG